MKVRFYGKFESDEYEMVELNEQGMRHMEDVAENLSGNWRNFILSASWDENGMYFYLDGPWEC